VDPSDIILKGTKETSPFLHAKTPDPDVLVKVAEELVPPAQYQRYPMDWCFFEDHAEYLDSELEPITNKKLTKGTKP
tara:strand:+ start:273 stop:503 length:231 start_codon:yes stop_codon:yes gene_type:complete